MSCTLHHISSRRLERCECTISSKGERSSADKLLGLVVNRIDADTMFGPDQAQLHALL